MEANAAGSVPDKLLVKPLEAARLLSVGRSMIYQLIASGALPSRRIGRAVRIPVAALRAWAEAQDGDTGEVRRPLRRVG